MKTNDIKQLTFEELKEKLAEERELYQKLKFSHAVSPVENPTKIKISRRLIARYLTELSARKLNTQDTPA